ncbi:lysophospholipid acyltransferase family protein [Fulvivirgaceae bacterium BMA10]|uniref:Lysophospholipid acyltransferase family protein n=1 Tax=Splendidivirga corallicola TaxID=3051826 RepID=A0ABT8KRQ8_9BACT|nr:lysophospholipid acyltransferase family protein [Fulvivirgaceae bacterium BMA10]
MFIIFLLKLLSKVPLRLLYLLSDFIAFVAIHLVKYRKKVVLENLRKSFPEKKEDEISTIAVNFYKHLADVVVETIKAISISKEEITERVEIRNLEIVEHYASQNQSVLVLTTHQCNWEWMLLSGCVQFPCAVDAVYLPLNNKRMDEFMYKARSRFGGTPISAKKIIKETIRRTRERTIAIGMLADQEPPAIKSRYWTTFLNQETAFVLGPQQLSGVAKMPVLFMGMERVKRGYYRVTIDKVAEPPYEKGNHDILETYIKKTEVLINANPSNWLWSHRRWKRKRPVNIDQNQIK